MASSLEDGDCDIFLAVGNEKLVIKAKNVTFFFLPGSYVLALRTNYSLCFQKCPDQMRVLQQN